jgi:hypothetical protein
VTDFISTTASAAAHPARPPEVAVADIDRLFERMRTIAPPLKVDLAWAKNFKLTDATIILNWLGLAKDSKVADPALWNRVRMPATRAASLADLVRASYAEIFDRVDVSEAAREDLESAFVNEYNLGDTRRYIRAFVTLCRHARIRVAAFDARSEGERDAPTTPPRSAPEGRKPATQPPIVQAPKGMAEEPQHRAFLTPAPAISVSIQIPADWTEDQILERVATVTRVLARASKP